MGTFFILCKREFLGYFRTPIAYIFMTAFCLSSVIGTFFLGQFLKTNQADLHPFFSLLPWFLLVIVPGIGMRFWAEEKSSGTIELVLTFPSVVLLI